MSRRHRSRAASSARLALAALAALAVPSPVPAQPAAPAPSPTAPSPTAPSPSAPSPTAPSPTAPSPTAPSPTAPSPTAPSPTAPSPSAPAAEGSEPGLPVVIEPPVDPTAPRPGSVMRRPEQLSGRPSGFWTSNRPAKGGAYRWRIMAMGGLVLAIALFFVIRTLRRASRERAAAVGARGA